LREVGKRVDVRDALAEFEKRMKPGEHEIDPALASSGALAEPTIAPPTRTVKISQKAFALTADQKETIAKLPKKVGEKYSVLVRQGIDRIAQGRVARGENPFDSYGNRFLWRACEMLLAGGFTKGTLRDAYQTLEGWSEGTAFSRVSIAVQLLTLMGVAVQRGSSFVVAPNLKGED
jgi:hypothetical protein